MYQHAVLDIAAAAEKKLRSVWVWPYLGNPFGAVALARTLVSTSILASKSHVRQRASNTCDMQLAPVWARVPRSHLS